MGNKLVAACLAAIIGAAPPAFAAQTVAPDSTIKGRLEKGDRKQNGDLTDTYTYLGKAGEELWIPWHSPPYQSVRLDVYGPGGLAVNDYGSGGRGIRLLQDGKVTILVHAGYPNDYEFSVYRLVSDPQPRTLASGQALRASFTTTDTRETPYNYQDSYTFTARAGESVLFHLEGQRSSLSLQVKGPNNFSRFGYNSGAGTVDVPAVFPADGQYEVKVVGDGGNYDLAAKRHATVATVPASRLNVGESTTLQFRTDLAAASAGGFAQVFTVGAGKGERVVVLRTAATGVKVWGPDGKAIATEDDIATIDSTYKPGDPLLSKIQFTAPAAGDYRIEVPVSREMTADQATLRIASATEGASMAAQGRAATDAVRAAKRQKVADLMRRGEQQMNSGQTQAAVLSFLDAVNLDRDAAVPAYFGAGLASYRQGGEWGYSSAASYFEMVLIQDPKNEAAKTNRALALEALAAFKRNQQAAYEQDQARRRQENAQFFSNMLNAFAMGVDLGHQINAANAPPPPVQAAPSPAPAVPSSQQASQTSKTSCGQAGVVYYYGAPDCNSASRRTHNPANDGTNCVSVVPNPRTNWGDAAYYFVNKCGWPVEVAWNRDSKGVFKDRSNIPMGGHYPTGFPKLPSPFPYVACKKRPEIGADLLFENGQHICIGPAA